MNADVAYLFGPAATVLDEELRLPGGCRPFFGIAPLAWIREDPAGAAADRWEAIASRCDELLEDEARSSEELPHADCLRAWGVLTLRQAAAAAEAAARAVFGDEIQDLALWCVKEGHVASVWKAAASGHEAVAINVPRDRIAEEALLASAAVLEELPGDKVARPLASPAVPVDERLMGVLVQPWMDDAREIAFLRDDADATVAVERFLVSESPPFRVKGVLGERMHGGIQQLAELLTSLVVVRDDAAFLPEIDVSRGDIVATPEGPRIVACGGGWRRMPEGEEPFSAILADLAIRASTSVAFAERAVSPA